MARIPESELTRLKAEVSIERLAIARGMQLVKKGRDFHTRCFLGTHEDTEASLVISPGPNLWRCFGCNQGGSVVDFVMRAERVSFALAVQLLKAELPSLAIAGEAPPTRPGVKHTSRQKLPGLLTADAQDRVLLGQVVDYYHETLKQSPEALAYLESRGLRHDEAIARFRLGFANRTLGYRLPMKAWKEGRALRTRLQSLGILRTTGHEHLVGSLVVPVFSAEGHVVQAYGRKITPNLRAGTPDHLYLQSPLRGVWNREGLAGSPEVILCEALLDALSFWVAGFQNVTTAYGVNHVPPELWDDFKTFGTRRVLIAFDRDEAGDRAARALAPKLQAAGLEVFRIQFPKGMDANEYLCKMKPAAKAFELVIRNAVWMGQGQAPAITSRAAEASAPAVATLEAAPPADPATASLFTQPSSAKTAPELPAASAPAPDTSAAPDESGKTAAKEGKAETEATPLDPLPAPPSRPSSPAQLLSLAATRADSAAPPVAPVTRIPSLAVGLKLARDDEGLWTKLGDRTYRVRDLEKNTSHGVLKVQLRVARDHEGVAGAGGLHVDSFDLSIDRLRQIFVKRAAEELGMGEEPLRREVSQLFLALELARDEEIRRRAKPAVVKVEMAEEDRAAALELLRAPDLLDQVLADFTRCGVVGEETNKLVGYLAAVSRKLDAPLAVVIQSSSAAGKSSLMEAVLAFMPEEERVAYSAMTGQSLFYMSEKDLAHKILAIAEEEGAQRASYALKLLQSEGELTIASTGKDPATGRLITHEYKVQGPVMIFLTTTAIEMDEELMNRCLVLTVDEGREQTRAIHKLQRHRQTLEGRLEEQVRRRIVKRHRDAQRLLRPLVVVNPYAQELTFLDHQTRTRRDHMKYLSLINAIALLHQHQREVKTATRDGITMEYVEVQSQDVALADRLMQEVLGHSLDELPPQTRQLLAAITDMVESRAKAEGLTREEVRFTRRDIRERTGLGNTQLKLHLKRLEDLEYLLVHAGCRGHSMIYELAYASSADEGASAPGASRYGAPQVGGHEPQVGGEDAQVGRKSPASRAKVGGWSALPGSTPAQTQSHAEATSPVRGSEKHFAGGNGDRLVVVGSVVGKGKP